MKYVTKIGIGLLVMTGSLAQAGEHEYCPPPEGHFLQRVLPVGGCNPGGGLFHWWDPRCFPPPCGPDDYCRKPFPRLCWPHCWTNAPPMPLFPPGPGPVAAP